MVRLDQPLISPTLVGRAAALAALEPMLHQARGGQGQGVLFAGEAGIGKSRLVAELRGVAARLGFLSLAGHCFEPDRSLPYAPLLDLLRARLAGRSVEDLRHELGPGAPELVKLLPELARLLPGLVPSTPLAPEQEKRRLFHALAAYFAGLALSQPLLLVVEDLHWSDAISLELLLYLLRGLRSQPILLLLTYRADEPYQPLSRFLAECERGRLATELLLTPLSLSEVDAMLRAIFDLDRPVRQEFLDALQGLTDGNPFFIEEVLKSLVASGDIFYAEQGWDRKPLSQLRIPRTVQDAVQRRAEQLSEGARELLMLAAVAGRRFDFALLQALTGQEERALLPLLKELMAAQLVVEASAEQFAFRHALTRQAVYAQLLARERRALHRSIAEGIERVYAQDLELHLQQLAYHFHAAEVWDKALQYGQRAGERAQDLYAPQAAVEQFSRALEAAQQLPMPSRLALYRARGLAYATLGDIDQARHDLEAALDLSRAAGHPEAEWQLLLDLGLLWAARDYAQTGVYYQQALAVAGAMHDRAALAYSLNSLGNWHMNVQRPLEGQRCHQQALAIFHELRDQAGIAETLDLLGLAYNMCGDLLQSASCYRQAVVLFRALDDRQRLASSLSVLASRGMSFVTDTLVWAADSPAEIIRDAEQAVQVAQEIGWRAGEAYALFVLGDCLCNQGQYDPGLQLARQALAIAQEIEHHGWMVGGYCTLGWLLLKLLAPTAACQQLEQALALSQQMGSDYWADIAAGLLASACVAQRDLVRAAAVLDAALGPDTPMLALGQRLCWLASAELALARGDAGLALETAGRLIASAPNASEGRVIPYLWHLRARALFALDRLAEAEQALQAAAAAAAGQGCRPLLWRVEQTLAGIYQAQGRREQAELQVAAAGTLVQELAAVVPDAELRQAFLDQASAAIPSLSRAPGSGLAVERLTRREREVALLIARGSSNRAIAAELVLSERTVEGHVTNILGKLGFASRAQVAAWVVEQGLSSGNN